MIYKSYLVEQNIEILKSNFTLFYGENLGLKNFFEKKLVNDKNNKVLKYSQDEILKNENNFYSEMNNISLFGEKKIFIINNATDKILTILKELIQQNAQSKCYIFSDVLEKKSKLRNFFEKEKNVDVVPCYQDNDLSIKKLIQSSLKEFTNLTSETINILLEVSSNDRLKLENEINKIKSYFTNKKIIQEDLIKLLNLKEDNDFNLIKDSALIGDADLTNKLLNSTLIENEKFIFYITLMNYRLGKLNSVSGEKNIEKAVNEIKPPVFWKDKPIFLKQAQKWNQKKINSALRKTYDAEVKIKSNSSFDKKIILKKLIVDICILANAT